MRLIGPDQASWRWVEVGGSGLGEVKLVRAGSSWFELVRAGLSYVELRRAGSIWIELGRAGLVWTELEELVPSSVGLHEPSWVRLCRAKGSDSDWLQLEGLIRAGLSWVELGWADSK